MAKKEVKHIVARWFGDDDQFGYRFRVELNEFDQFQFECFWSTTGISSKESSGYIHLWHRDIVSSASSATMLCRIMKTAETRIRADYKKNGPDRSLGQQMLRVLRGYGVTHVLPENRRPENPLDVVNVVELMDRFISDRLPEIHRRLPTNDRPNT